MADRRGVPTPHARAPRRRQAIERARAPQRREISIALCTRTVSTEGKPAIPRPLAGDARALLAHTLGKQLEELLRVLVLVRREERRAALARASCSGGGRGTPERGGVGVGGERGDEGVGAQGRCTGAGGQEG